MRQNGVPIQRERFPFMPNKIAPQLYALGHKLVRVEYAAAPLAKGNLQNMPAGINFSEQLKNESLHCQWLPMYPNGYNIPSGIDKQGAISMSFKTSILMSFHFWVQPLGVSLLKRHMPPLSHAKGNLLITQGHNCQCESKRNFHPEGRVPFMPNKIASSTLYPWA